MTTLGVDELDTTVVAAIRAGNVEELRSILRENPEVPTARFDGRA